MMLTYNSSSQVKVYLERRSLVHSLNDTKTAVDELNNLASVIVLVVIIIVWLIIMGFLTTQDLVFISSQLLLVVFMFGNMAKTVFEAIIFVFVMHPFDVGDRCVIDGVQVVFNPNNSFNFHMTKSIWLTHLYFADGCRRDEHTDYNLFEI